MESGRVWGTEQFFAMNVRVVSPRLCLFACIAQLDLEQQNSTLQVVGSSPTVGTVPSGTQLVKVENNGYFKSFGSFPK